MHVLVHIDLDQGLGPIGAWGFNGQLKHFYPESLDPAISARARELMAQRTPDISVPDWMDLIADSDPNPLDSFHTGDVNDGDSLPVVLAEYRRIWNSTTD
jgi:hypothetical protein